MSALFFYIALIVTVYTAWEVFDFTIQRILGFPRIKAEAETARVQQK